jgi:hypothetical protein
VRHRRRAFLAGREIFLRLEHFGALEVADLGGEPLDRRGDDAQRREEHRMAIARDDLRRDGLDRQAELGGDMLLHRRIDIGEGADRAGDRAGGDIGARRDQPGLAAVELGIGLRELEAEGDRLGMDAVAAADRRRHLMLDRAALEHREQGVEVGEQDVGGARELHREAGVEHVGRGHALMHEARLIADVVRDPGEEGDDVMLGDRLDRVDRGHVDIGVGSPPRPQRLGGFPGHDAQVGERIGGMRLDLEPDAETRLRRPDRGHLGAGITGDHSVPSS